MLRTLLLFYSLILLTFGASHAQVPGIEDKELINGVTLPMHSFDYSFDYSDMVTEISDLGAKWIQVNIKFYQENIYSSRIVSDTGYDAYWNQFEQILIKAKKENLKVTILPIVLLANPQGSNWRGLIEPYDLDKWFRYYKKMILKVATMAEQHNADMLTVGSELVNLQQYTSRWEDVIKEIRANFSGNLNYAANWDAYETIGFLDKLDYLGISGYFDLTTSTNPSNWSLRYSWGGIKSQIFDFQEANDIPIIFTELGYTSQDGTNMHPWNYYATDVVDLEEQKACYQAFIDVWGDEEDFHGVFFYDWYDEGGPEDTGYTIKNKPAEEIVKKWFEQINE